MGARIGSGLSQHPDPRVAAVEAGTAARAGLGGRHADLAVVFSSGAHLMAPELVLEGAGEALDAPALIGCGAGGVLADDVELEEGTAVSAWACAFDDGGSAETFALTPDAPMLPDLEGAAAVLLLADAGSFPVEQALEVLGQVAPGVPVIGGVASSQPAGLLVGDAVLDAGAVGVVLRGVEVLPCVSQGAAPIGPALEVTSAEGHLVHELSGRPALDALRDAIEGLSPFERAKLAGGLLLGVEPDAVQGPDGGPPEAHDVLIRGLLGADTERGSIAVGAQLEVGTIVRLHVRDAASADRDLREALALRREAFGGRPPAGALMFTCNGRGSGMFGRPGHDAGALRDELGDVPVAGFFAAGEIGPVGGAAFLHAFTATVAVFAP